METTKVGYERDVAEQASHAVTPPDQSPRSADQPPLPLFLYVPPLSPLLHRLIRFPSPPLSLPLITFYLLRSVTILPLSFWNVVE